MSDRVTCQLCGSKEHAIKLHLRDNHPEVSLEEYQRRYPDAPVLSDLAKAKIAAKLGASTTDMATSGAAVVAKIESLDEHRGFRKAALHEVFELGKVPAALSFRGDGIPITVLTNPGDFADMVPAKDPGYIFSIELLKTTIMGLELAIPTYLWGHAGTGKTTMHEQVAAFTGRPFMRVQHTANTEESHILGQWTAREGQTVFELGPLPMAMKHGLVYCADEYDFAMPSVLSVYQPVLEGKALVIKEADHANRIIRPHPNFRFVATGNTNGAGDETGLYQGTNLQNAANYERFGIVEEVRYMPEKQEIGVIMNQAKIGEPEARKMVMFANEVRKAYEGGKISAPVSPRALINAAKIGVRRGDWKLGLRQSFSNRLTRVDREVVDGLAQRIFS